MYEELQALIQLLCKVIGLLVCNPPSVVLAPKVMLSKLPRKLREPQTTQLLVTLRCIHHNKRSAHKNLICLFAGKMVPFAGWAMPIQYKDR